MTTEKMESLLQLRRQRAQAKLSALSTISRLLEELPSPNVQQVLCLSLSLVYCLRLRLYAWFFTCIGAYACTCSYPCTCTCMYSDLHLCPYLHAWMPTDLLHTADDDDYWSDPALERGRRGGVTALPRHPRRLRPRPRGSGHEGAHSTSLFFFLFFLSEVSSSWNSVHCDHTFSRLFC